MGADKEYSSAILLQRVENPKFLSNLEELEKFKEAEFPGSFSFSLSFSHGDIALFGLIDNNQPESPIVDIKFVASDADEKLAFVDVLLELCLNKNEQSLSTLGFREIESYLRDYNHIPGLPNRGTSFVPYFEKIKEALGKAIIESRGHRSGEPSSPTLSDDYKPGDKLCIEEFGAGPFLDLTIQKKSQVLNQVLAKYVRPFLHRDRGDIECLFIDGPMVVVNYLGVCAHCTKSLTTTMDYIQKVLRIELDQPEILVVTDS